MRIAIIGRRLYLVFSIVLIILIIIGVFVIRPLLLKPAVFDANRAYANVKYQMDLGPRSMGSQAHEQAAQWIISNLQASDWQVDVAEKMDGAQGGISVKNIIGKRGSGSPWVIIGSHYDSRSVADQDPDPARRALPVPGADDGASTVSILLELARVIPSNLDKQVWLVFFDDEDNGKSDGTGWSIGAKYFVDTLQGKPDGVVILDMLGDKNLKVYMEKNSDPAINSEIWAVADGLGFSQFIPTYMHSIIDDHIPFIDAGIRAVDVIDIDYPYWHTTQDTLDKISANSLKIVGDTILKWLKEYPKP
jgi:glutaminyl-peptide cyclotransferase